MLCWLAILSGFTRAAVSADSWTEGAGFRFRPLSPPPPGNPGFTLMSASDTGASFTNRLAQSRFVTNQIYLNGSGVALGDVDGDGRCDIFLAGLDGPNALFRNLGAWRFTNIAAQAGVEMPGLDCTGAALADLDGDGDLDLVVNTIGTGTHIFLNDGHGKFIPLPGGPFNLGRGGMSLALADVDGDGDLDIYVANYRTDTFRDQPGTRFRGKNLNGQMVLQTVNGRPVTDPDLVGRYTILPNGGIFEHGEADLVLRNDSGGHFTPMALTDGMFLDETGAPLKEPIYDWTQAAMFRDVNGDGAPDLYVCNDFQDEDRFWLNDGRGHLRPAPPLALRHVSMFSMSADFGDLDRDGVDDLVTVDMLSRTHARRLTKLGDTRAQFSPPGVVTNRPQYAFNQFHRGRGDGTFSEIAWYAGLQASDWTWNLALIDVDLDGYEDALMATGHELDWMDADLNEKTDQMRARRDLPPSEVPKLKLMFPRLNLSNFAFRNRGDLTFEEVGASWHFNLPVITHGLAAADLDGDGDLDLVLNNLNDPASLLRNDSSEPRLVVRLRGSGANSAGVGARIRVTGGPVPQSQEIVSGGRYLSSDDACRVFAAGKARELAIEVIWPSGRVSKVPGVLPNHVYEVFESGAAPGGDRSTMAPQPLFSVVGAFTHRHVDEPFDDFASQPLLPNRLSQLGPGVVWADLDGDGRDDLAVGSGKGGALSIWHNVGGSFQPWNSSARPAERDQLGMVAWPTETNRTALLVAVANWEDGQTNGAALEQSGPGGVTSVSILGASRSSPGVLAAADVDGDGDLDLWMGGRAVPGRYPEGASSLLLLNSGGHLEVDRAADRAFARLGMVAGATWSDLGGDGFPDLVVDCDWGPIRIFRNDRGKLSDWDPELRVDAATARQLGGRVPARLSALTGCWTGVASVDLDGDGRMDLVMGNWGLNSRWQLAGDRPLRLYFGDYDANGTDEINEAAFVPELSDYAPLRSLRAVAPGIPFVREVAPTHKAFSESTVARLLGTRMEQTSYVEAAVLASVALLNRGEAFELRCLPPAAQWSPVFAVVPADFDGDGHEDVFLGQNFFGVHGDAARQDAGRGLLLHGDGKGGFEVWEADRSGVAIYGEQRGAATADYDADGRPDLVVTQNSGETVLLHNRGGRPGLRIGLTGPPGNPAGIGAIVRLKFGDRWGPAREIAGGSGWFSQNSPVVVLATPERPTALEVRWPGGKRSEVPVEADQHEVRVPWSSR